jgi:hypothetical protein
MAAPEVDFRPSDRPSAACAVGISRVQNEHWKTSQCAAPQGSDDALL